MIASGYYWVIARDAIGMPRNEWTIAEFREDSWLFPGDAAPHAAGDVLVMGPLLQPPPGLTAGDLAACGAGDDTGPVIVEFFGRR